MEYKIFVDTNIIFEHAVEREFGEDCRNIFNLAEDEKIRCHCSIASLYTLEYVLRKHRSQTEIKYMLNKYLQFIHLICPQQNKIQQALVSSFKDIEDAFQYYTALHHTDFFITLNKKDFVKHSLPDLEILTPSEFLKHYFN